MGPMKSWITFSKSWKQPCPTAVAGMKIYVSGHCLNNTSEKTPIFCFEAAPKPRLTEESYKSKTWWSEWNALSEEEQWQRAEAGDWIISEKEPLFDAADVGRYGKDLFIQKSMVTNRAGVDWLRDIIIPTYAEMVHPEKILQGIKTKLMFLVYSFPWHSNNYRLSPWKRRGSLQYS